MTTEPDHVERRLRELATQHGKRCDSWGIWAGLGDPDTELPAQGWKIHVSARPSTLDATLDAVLPILLESPCDFKVIRSIRLLHELNSSTLQPGNVGKAVTVYPRSADAFRELVCRLAEALAGFQGPRVNSDRRFRADSPVYYRFGPFKPVLAMTENGALEVVVKGPQGEQRRGAAGSSYWQPDWVEDPFPQAAPESGEVRIGGRYRVTKGVQRSAKGAVYRAVDTETGQPVIVKEARAFIDEDRHGRDACSRLRHERKILEALAGLDGIPAVIDHFRHGQDEFLVTTSMGDTNLARSVGDHGVYGTSPERNLVALAEELVALLDRVHERGVVVRDFTPMNLVPGADGRLGLVDFEVSRYDDDQFFGWTAGFTPVDQQENDPAVPTDDYYSLGATLFYAATGRDPSFVPGTPTYDVERLQLTLEITHPDRSGLVGLIPLLLQPDHGKRAEVVDRIRRRACGRTAAEDAMLARRVFTADHDRLEGIIRHTSDSVADYARRLLRPDPLPPEVFSSPCNVYYGAAGMGTELLHHGEEHRELAADLAHWALRRTDDHKPKPGLMFGGTGTAVFAATAGVLTGDEELVAGGRRLADELGAVTDIVPGLDFTHGQAGLAVAELHLWRLMGGQEHLDRAARSVRRLVDNELREQEPPDYRDQPAVAAALGFAHGLAGHAFAVLAHRDATGSDEHDRVLHEYVDVLKARMAEFARLSGETWLSQMNASWCQGLSGMGSALVRAATALGRDDVFEVLDAAATACLATAPRMLVVTQCCGIAAVGEYLLDLAVATGDERYFRRAETAFRLIQVRAGGEVAEPEFPDSTRIGSSGCWAVGSAGVLSFARRLRHRTADRLWYEPVALPVRAG